MALPKISVPLYELKLPLTKQEITFRPFLVKEEKILLMAVEADDEKSILLAIKQIVNNCVINDIDIDSLPMTDLEFIFLNLRARSINEIVELSYTCNNNIDDKKCGNLVKFDVNLLEIYPTIPENHTSKIDFGANIGIVMKYPNFKIYEKMDKTKSEIESMIGLLIECVDYIYDADTIYYSKDTTKEELQDFLESLTQEQFKKVQDFFNTMPKIKTTVKFDCTKCGYKENIEVEGIQNFFS